MRQMSGILLLVLLYLGLAALPLALAEAQSLPRRPWRDELSSALAITAFAMLLLEFALSGRYRRLSARIGMDVTMRFHQLVGLVVVVLLLLHPVLYSLPYAAQRPWDVTRVLTLTLTPSATVSGLVAWALVGLTVALAYFRDDLPFSYEAWRASHGIGALAIAGFGTHHAIDTGRYAQDPAMRAFWLLACGLAIASLAHAYLVKPLLQRRRKHAVAAVTREAEMIWRITLQPTANRPFRFVAGQFVWIKFLRAFGRITEHPFSIASSPARLPRLDFLVREAGDFTSKVGSLRAGTPAFIDGPYGNFTLEAREGVGIMLIAGGVGIAPILSIARSLAERRDPRPVVLVYADRNERQLAARSELELLQRDHNFDVRYILAEPPQPWSGLRGRLDYENVAKCAPTKQANRWLYFVCGPPAMIDTVELALARLGVPLAQIVSERFRYGTGIATPRERLTRTVIAGIVLTLVLGALAFTVR